MLAWKVHTYVRILNVDLLQELYLKVIKMNNYVIKRKLLKGFMNIKQLRK